MQGARDRRNRCPAPGKPRLGQAAAPAQAPLDPAHPVRQRCTSPAPGMGGEAALALAELARVRVAVDASTTQPRGPPGTQPARPTSPTSSPRRGRAVLALVWPGTASGQRGSGPSGARTQGTRSPTAAHVQPDHPAAVSPAEDATYDGQRRGRAGERLSAGPPVALPTGRASASRRPVRRPCDDACRTLGADHATSGRPSSAQGRPVRYQPAGLSAV